MPPTYASCANVSESLLCKVQNRIERLPWSGCWIWMGATNRAGYAKASNAFTGQKTRIVHRAILQEQLGVQLPINIYACHSCDVPSCINPAHIWPGTQLDNLRDAINKGKKIGSDGAFNARKTHCPYGHEYTQKNTRMKSGTRQCKACHKVRLRDWKRKQRAMGRKI